MKKTQTWVAVTAAGVLAVVVAGWFLLISPRRAEAADLHAQAATQRTAVDALRVRLSTLRAQAEGLPAQQARLAAVAAKMPSDAGVPDLVRSLTAAAASSGVELVSLAPGGLAPLTVTSPGASTASLALANAAAADVRALPLTLNVVGGYPEVERYLAALEGLPRAVLVTGLAIAPGVSPTRTTAGGTASTAATDGSSLTATITAQAFVLLSSTSAPAAAGTSSGTPGASAAIK